MPLAGHDAGGLLSAPIVEGNFNPRAPCGARRQPRHVHGIPVHDFNPHAPCGARLAVGGGLMHIRVFQSTCPLRGTTQAVARIRRLHLISIHMPLAGHDQRTWTQAPRPSYFNPHAPCGARRFRPCTASACPPISIHMHLAGHDQTERITTRRLPVFQSTCPLRGTTRRNL